MKYHICIYIYILYVHIYIFICIFIYFEIIINHDFRILSLSMYNQMQSVSCLTCVGRLESKR